MADIKWNDGKIVFGEDGFEVNSGDVEKYGKTGHDETNALETIGAGSKKTIHLDPTILPDDGYIDLPAETNGRGFILVGDGEYWVDFEWDRFNTVLLIDGTGSTNPYNADEDDKFCVFDNTDSVRIKNRLGAAKRIMFDAAYTEEPLAPTFRVFNIPSGVDNLDPYLTINGTTVTPTFRYKGGDANATDWDAWTYGADLTLQSVATPPTYNDGSPGLGTNDDSCKFNASDYYKNATAVNQFTTGDIVVELVFKFSGSGGFLFDTISTNGLACYDAANTKIYVWMNDDDGQVQPVSGTDLVIGCWYHAICFINRDEASVNGSRWYLNGIESGSGTNCSGTAKTLTSSHFLIGARLTGDPNFDSNIAYLAAWEQASWHQAGAAGPAEWATIAKERFQKLCGIYPEIAHNSANLLVDGDMEAVGTADWTARGNGSLSKETSSPYSGTRNLRITYVDTTYYGASQTCLTVGHKYRITGYMRGDGTNAPLVSQYSSGSTLAIGTSSTSWQEFDVYFTAVGSGIVLRVNVGAAGYVEYDDVTVTCLGYIPITATRAFNAYIDKMDGDYRKLYYVGSEWLRMCHRVDKNGVNVRGYLPETQATNLFTYSEALSNWAKHNAGDTVTDNAIVGPDGRTVVTSIGADSSVDTHYYSQTIACTVQTYALSMFVKPGNKTWVNIQNLSRGWGCYFDVANGVIGTASGCVGYIEGPFYSGDVTPVYRCCIVFTGVVASDLMGFIIADSDGDIIISDGDGSPSLYVWGAQCEAGDYMTSPIRTAGSAATRLKDNLQFVAGDNIGGEDVGQGTIRADVLFPSYDSETSCHFCNLSDGGNTADRIALSTNASGDILYGLGKATGGNDGGCASAGDVINGEKHTVSVLWETDNLRTVLDGVIGTADTDCGMPDDLDEITIGQNLLMSFQTNGLIQNLRIYNIPTTKG